MEINKTGSFAQIWLTTSEQNDPEIKASLPALIRKYRNSGFLPVVYRSGEKDLQDGIKDLLLYNQKLLAKREDRSGS